MLINIKDSVVMLIDAQEKLMPLVQNTDTVEQHCRWLLEIAQYLEVPTLITEQYPKGLGPTIQSLRDFATPKHTLAKTCFSALGSPEVNQLIHDWHHNQFILIGIESHVCGLQTAMTLQNTGKQVFVDDECTSSRDAHDKMLALKRMRQQGMQVVSREMVVFEWLTQSGSEKFKHISEAYIK